MPEAIPSPLHWQGPRQCSAGTCVQVATTEDHVYVRDGKHPEGTPLRFTHEEWRAFVASVRDGQFSV